MFDSRNVLDFLRIFLEKTFYAKVLGIPFVFWWVLFAAIIVTLRLRYPILMLGHALKVARGDYDNEDAPGCITHKASIMTACLGTIGLGSVGGMAGAIVAGGPGSILWMILLFPIISSLKCAEVYFGHKYRISKGDHFYGGAYYYIRNGLGSQYPNFSQFLAKFYAITFFMGVMVAPCLLQMNQMSAMICDVVGNTKNVMLALSIATAIIVIPASFTEIKVMSKIGSKLTPLMLVGYIVGSLVVICVHWQNLPGAVKEIFNSAFSYKSFISGGVTAAISAAVGRIIFTAETGSGSSAMSHAATKTNEPMREGIASILEALLPIVVCVMTGFVIVITGAHKTMPELNGLLLTKAAFSLAFGEKVTTILFLLCVPVLAMTTVILWAFYGRTVWSWVFARFADRTINLYRACYTISAIIGVYSCNNIGVVLEISDFTYDLAAFANTIALLLMIKEASLGMKAYLLMTKHGAKN